nr:ribonuclease H-like domain-containing protein [Tanacetum cinerariifolium]
MNKLVRHNLVRGLPTKSFDNDHTYTACLKGKQHKASLDAGANATNLSGTEDAVNQEVRKDVSSLRYIVLPNWAHDALLESSSNETIGVEADVSNMETSISASPTPTLRVHKDHPKSQIIGYVDTLIQTRHTSKMMEEQSFIATIHQKTDPALLQFCLFSCF